MHAMELLEIIVVQDLYMNRQCVFAMHILLKRMNLHVHLL